MRLPRSVLPAVLAGCCLVALAACTEGGSTGGGSPPSPARSSSKAPSTAPPATLDAGPGQDRPTVVRTVATGLQVPWGVTFLPDGTALVGERDTTRVLSISGSKVRLAGRVEDARPTGEAGLLGLATSPSYAQDRLIYAYVST